MQSLLTRAGRCANSQASASNAGVPGDPNSPESNCLYLTLILSIKELYIMGIMDTVNSLISMLTQSIQPKHVFTQ